MGAVRLGHELQLKASLIYKKSEAITTYNIYNFTLVATSLIQV